jgi:hypothetical protein
VQADKLRKQLNQAQKALIKQRIAQHKQVISILKTKLAAAKTPKQK